MAGAVRESETIAAKAFRKNELGNVCATSRASFVQRRPRGCLFEQTSATVAQFWFRQKR